MSKCIKVFIVLLMAAALRPFQLTSAADVKINDLIEEAMAYDGQRATVTAEAIGERMDRTDGTWVNVHDGSNAIGIWMTREEAEKINTFGSFRQTGDTLEITGIFNRACKEHGGEADIHLISMNIVKTGEAIERSIGMAKIAATVLLVSMAALIFMVFLDQSKYPKDMEKR